MKLSVFEFNDYRKYLQLRFPTNGVSRGLRSRFAEAIQTKPAFISQVFSGTMNLSPEHLPPTNELLKHTPEEAHYFTLLVLFARAGSPELERYYRNQIREIQEERKSYLGLIDVQEAVSNTDQALYYSQWFYSAIHMITAVPKFQSREALSERLGLPLQVVSKTLDDLLRMGLVEKKSGRYVTGKKRIHIEKGSPWVSQFHSQYRNRAIQRLIDPEPNDFHLTSGLSASKEVMEELRRRFLELLSEFEPKIAESKEDDLYAINIDLFRF